MSALSSLPRSSGPESDLEALLARMRQRLYPETIPVLASYWLRTVCDEGHQRGWWKELDALLKEVLHEQVLDAQSRDVLVDVRNWVQQSLSDGKTPGAAKSESEPFRTNLRPEWLAPYVGRLLNEWLSAEVATLLVSESEFANSPEVGIPVLAVGRALERLLMRERLSPGTLEMFLQPEQLSPRYVYPADAEILRDVVLSLLGRTWAPPFPLLPATILGVAAGSSLPADFGDAIRRASVVVGPGGEEIHVPIAAAQAMEISKNAPIRIASIIVTMDGRWWRSENLQSGEQHSVIYRAGGRLRIDYSAEHAKLNVPWPDTQLRWSGGVHFQAPFELFGREWHAASWETDGQRTWLHLVFKRTLPIAETQPAAEAGFRRSRPAGVDIAWAALGNALAASIVQKNREPVEQLRRCDFIPLGRAIWGLVESMKDRRLSKREMIETQLKAIRYLQAEISPEYGRVPWGILPLQVRATFLKKRPDPALLELLNEVFDALPDVLDQPKRKDPGVSGEVARTSSPSHAA
jgi:hypothetical protein